MIRRGFLKLLGMAPLAASVPAAAALPMTLAQAKAKLEEGRIVKTGHPWRLCQTGDPYIVITAGGVKAEGEAFLGWCTSKADAVRMWLEATSIYVSNRRGTLYWRHLPELESREDSEGQVRYQIYSRLVVTDNPELNLTVDEMTADDRFSPGKFLYERDGART